MTINFGNYKRVNRANDDFNRADGNLGAPNWTQANTNWGFAKIVNNEVTGSAGQVAPTGNPFVVWTGSGPIEPDQYAEIEITSLPFQSDVYHVGPVVRGSTDDHPNEDMYWAFVDCDVGSSPYGTRFGKTVNGVDTTFIDKIMPWAVGDRIGLEVIGNELRVTKNGSYLGDEFYKQDDSLSSGYPGIITSTAGDAARGDNWVAGNLVSTSKLGPAIIRKTRTKQPPAGTKIDWSNPLTNGLVRVCRGNEDVLLGRQGRKTTIATNVPEESYYPGPVFPASVVYGLTFGAIPLWNGIGQYYRDTDTDYPNDQGLQIRCAKAYGQVQIYARNDINAGLVCFIDVVSGNIEVGDYYVFGATIDEVYDVRAFLDGAYVASDTTTFSGATIPTPTSGNTVWGVSDNIVDDPNTLVEFVYRYDRVISDEAHRALAENPWQIFEPETIFIPEADDRNLVVF